MNLQFRSSAGCDFEPHCDLIEELPAELVAVAAYLENHRVAQECRVIYGRYAGGIGDERHLIESPQLDQRDSPAGRVVCDMNDERFAVLRQDQHRSEKQADRE
jgi:hypothetical protein